MHTDRKVALLHYWLTNMRGGEQVFLQLCRLFPEADIYTHAMVAENLPSEITSHRVCESFIAALPSGRRSCQKYLPLMPSALKRWDLSEYEVIISSESGPVKGIRKPSGAKHICYCHTPMRYLYDMYDEYYKAAGLAGRLAMKIFRNHLRDYDLKSAECVDLFMANSKFVAERIKRIYGRDSEVVYPPVDVGFFSAARETEKEYYLFAGALVCYKHPEIAVEAFRRSPDKKLIVLGDGPMKKSLMRNAPDNVEFISDVSRKKLRELYAGAKALIFPGIEDFGIIPVEAQAAGCPVIARSVGGTAETVIDGKTGVLIDALSVQKLAEAVETAEGIKWHKENFFANTERFSVERFCREFMDTAAI